MLQGGRGGRRWGFLTLWGDSSPCLGRNIANYPEIPPLCPADCAARAVHTRPQWPRYIWRMCADAHTKSRIAKGTMFSNCMSQSHQSCSQSPSLHGAALSVDVFLKQPGLNLSVLLLCAQPSEMLVQCFSFTAAAKDLYMDIGLPNADEECHEEETSLGYMLTSTRSRLPTRTELGPSVAQCIGNCRGRKTACIGDATARSGQTS